MNRRDLFKGILAAAAVDLVPEEAKKVENTQILSANKNKVWVAGKASPVMFSAGYWPETHKR